jgi:hypothetical protein
MHIFLINILIYNFDVFYTFRTDDSSSGRRLYVQLWYGTFCMHQYMQSTYTPPTKLHILMHVKYTIP